MSLGVVRRGRVGGGEESGEGAGEGGEMLMRGRAGLKRLTLDLCCCCFLQQEYDDSWLSTSRTFLVQG